MKGFHQSAALLPTIACLFASALSQGTYNEIADSQNVTAETFIGSPATAQQMTPKQRFIPEVVNAHMDGGNSRSEDWTVPLGQSIQVNTRDVPLAFMYWGSDDSLVAAMTCGNDSLTIQFCLEALDPDTFDTLGEWSDTNRTILSNYFTVKGDNIVVSTVQNAIVELEKVTSSTSNVTFNIARDIDLSSILPEGQITAAAAYSTNGNIWFFATSVPLVDLGSGTSATIGYIDTAGNVYTQLLEDQVIENSMAVHNGITYLITGPAGAEDVPDALGHFYAFQADANNSGIVMIYNETYNAGSAVKAGGFSRGSGATPSLLGDKYVSFTDNADAGISVVIYRQPSNTTGSLNNTAAEAEFVCQIPVFGALSANEAAMPTHYEESTGLYTVNVANSYNTPAQPYLDAQSDINGVFNNYTQMSPGMTQIQVTEDGNCSVSWELDTRVATTMVTSTGSGLIYYYTQDAELAIQGEYVWYMAAVDYRTGVEDFRQKIGEGGIFNPTVSQMAIGPTNNVYQGVTGGLSWITEA